MGFPVRLGRARAKPATALALTGLATAAVAALAAPASAATAASSHGHFPDRASHAVFVQTDNTAGNQVVAYHRSGSGTLTLAGTYSTGGNGGQLTGSVVDHLASQGSLQYDARQRLVIAVNAGSNTVSVFWAFGDRLVLRQVISSGGTFPVSVAIHGNLVYVVNALNGGSIQGYRLFSRPAVPAVRLEPAPEPRPHRYPAVHQHARPGRVLAKRVAADRDHEGQRQRHRRVRGRRQRPPVRQRRW